LEFLLPAGGYKATTEKTAAAVFYQITATGISAAQDCQEQARDADKFSAENSLVARANL